MIKAKKIYLIGIGGISMSGVARILKGRGFQVSGSDIKESEETKKLKEEGIDVSIGHQKGNITREIEIIVKTEAIPDSNSELIEAQKLGIPVWSRTKMIQELSDKKRLIAVAGTHGKSTISAMIAFILTEAGKDPLAFLGAESEQLGGTVRDGEGDWAVTEACEYRGQFWELEPELAVISNIEAEHLDFFQDLQGVKEGFKRFLKNLKGRLFVYSGDRVAVSVVKEWGGDFQTYDDQEEKLDLKLFGQHNQINGQAAIAIAQEVGISSSQAAKLLSQFQGIKRRSEYLGQKEGIKVYDDYAHHPTEITTTLKAFREEFPDQKLLVVFQPHQGQRLTALFDQFNKSLRLVDRLIIVKVYEPPGRDRKAGKDSKDLAQALKAKYAKDYNQALREVQSRVKRGEILLTMGAGPVNRVAEKYLRG